MTGLSLRLAFLFSGVCHLYFSFAQTGSINAPVAYVGSDTVDPAVHEGGLRYAVGVENIQTLRANRSHPDSAEGSGWTYNHGSNLCYWNGRFYQHYLSNPADEHIAPGQTLVMTSVDGRSWNKPEVVFPPYHAPAGVGIPAGYHGYMMHQRMGFFIAPDGRLLVLGFYGHTEDPFGPGGIGRVVREAYRDGSYGPIYFIRYSSFNKWDETNTGYPFYKSAPDTGFVAACAALLGNKLMTFQWFEEDSGKDGFYGTKTGAQAFNWYTRKDGTIVGLWKKSLGGLSTDNGNSFSRPATDPGFIMSGGKQWGQRTADGRYAICYNPIDLSEYRYPLALVTSDDGITYDHLLLVQGEVPPRRFTGRWKDFGPCYMRGIEEGNGRPPGTDMWLSYSMNKEDIWIARIPTPITWNVSGPVNDNFDTLKAGGTVPGWNLYSPRWATVKPAASPGRGGVSLKLSDSDPYDYARAIRVFETGKSVHAKFNLFAESGRSAPLEIDLTDGRGRRAVRLRFDSAGRLRITNGKEQKAVIGYREREWIEIDIRANTGENSFDVAFNGRIILKKARFAERVESLERISFRTGAYRNEPTRNTPNEITAPPLPGCDEPVKPTVFYLDEVLLKSTN